MSSDFSLESALVSVKLFRPAVALSEASRLSDALLVWVEGVLREYMLTTIDLFSTVTDAAGSDVRRLCLKVESSSWECCFPHMLNCALAEVRGFHMYVQNACVLCWCFHVGQSIKTKLFLFVLYRSSHSRFVVYELTL